MIGSVTDYSPWYPPRCGMRVEWYAANPGYHEIPPGYGLPWGTPEEEFIPAPLVFEAEMALAKAQLATQSPGCAVPPEPPPDASPSGAAGVSGGHYRVTSSSPITKVRAMPNRANRGAMMHPRLPVRMIPSRRMKRLRNTRKSYHRVPAAPMPRCRRCNRTRCRGCYDRCDRRRSIWCAATGLAGRARFHSAAAQPCATAMLSE